MYDLIIVGAGPAGITAGIYAIRKRMNVLIITRDLGGQTNLTANIENYTGYQLITGCDLVKRFKDHIGQFNVDIQEAETVNRVYKKGDAFVVEATSGTYEARSVVVASGSVRRKLNIPGEDTFLGKGLAYCATCDAPLFADMNVAVVGGGNSGLDAAVQLSKIAKTVHVINMEAGFTADRIMVERLLASDRVTVHHQAKVTEVMGEKFVNSIRMVENGTENVLPVEGIFVEIGWVPASKFVEGVERNERNEIIVNCSSETNIPGLFAAGDVSNVPAKQIIVACGEGAKAAVSAFRYVNEKIAVKP